MLILFKRIVSVVKSMGIFSKNQSNQPNNVSKISRLIHIKKINLAKSRDFLVLRQNLNQGNIMICNLNPLFRSSKLTSNENQNNYQQLQQIKRFCMQSGGSVSKIDDHLLLITPNKNIKIQQSTSRRNHS